MDDTGSITYEPLGGEEIGRVCSLAQRLAETNSRPVIFKFNDVRIVVRPGDTRETLCALYNARLALNRRCHQCGALQEPPS